MSPKITKLDTSLANDASVVGFLLGGGLGALWGVIIFASFCFYPDDVPCTPGGFAFVVGLTTIPSLVICGLPLALFVACFASILLPVIQQPPMIVRAAGWFLCGVSWAALNGIGGALLLQSKFHVIMRPTLTVAFALALPCAIVLWCSPHRFIARAFASGIFVTALVLVLLS
jgi:hypothetical protein